MIFDTDIFIWFERGNKKAAKLIESTEEKMLSLLTYMELLQGAHSKQQHEVTRGFLQEYNFTILPLNENIGQRAAIYIEEYALSNGLQAGDAIIAATAVENNLTLASGNTKHFRSIKELRLKPFKP